MTVGDAPPRRSIEPVGGPDGDFVAPTTLAATFDGNVVPEARAQRRLVRFLTGAGTGGSSAWIRGPQDTNEARVQRLFSESEAVSGVLFGAGFYAIEVHDPVQWHDALLPLLVVFSRDFAAPRPAPVPDRQAEIARTEFATIDPTSQRGIARVRDALTSPNPTMRQLAVDAIGEADPFSAERAWRVAIDDPARNVRRSAVRAVSQAQRTELRAVLERAVTDSDACTRFHAARGLAIIGAARSRHVLEKVERDGDARVRLAVEAALFDLPIPD